MAATAEELMRSRYSAYAVGDLDYVWRTWHPRTRPETVTPSDEVWTGLEIVDTVAGAQATTRVSSSSALITAETDEAGRCMSGPASPLEPVVGSMWTGSYSVDRSDPLPSATHSIITHIMV